MRELRRRAAAARTRASSALDSPRWGGRSRHVALLALGAYIVLSLALYGRHTLLNINTVVAGFGPGARFFGHDQSLYVWSIAWAARFLTHGSNLFLTNEVFAPVGYNLAWATSLPGPALLISPVTLLFGPITSYNILALLAPAMAAWTAFLLCRELTSSTPAAFAGGLLFGFGTYESVEMVNHLTLSLVALAPLAALLVLRRYRGRISRRRFILALGAVLAMQLWTASEVLASMVGFGVLAFLIGALLGGRSRLQRIGGTGAEALGALVLAGVLASPYLYYVLRYPNSVTGYGAGVGTDVANFLVPTRVTWLQSVGIGGTTRDLQSKNLTEQLGYIGLPLILMIACWGFEFRRSVMARCVLAFMFAATVASLGRHALVEGRAFGLNLPWSWVSELPLLRFAIPTRFMLYAWLAVALAAASWLARPSRPRLRWALLILVIVSLAPNATGVPWGTQVDKPALLADRAQLARYVPQDAVVLALPFGISGESMFWQVEAGFRMRLAGGYLSPDVPRPYRHYGKLLTVLQGGLPIKSTTRELCKFLRYTGTSVVLLRDGSPRYFFALLAGLGVPVDAGGFWVYELNPSAETPAPPACG
jgi:hypothetical protein